MAERDPSGACRKQTAAANKRRAKRHRYSVGRRGAVLVVATLVVAVSVIWIVSKCGKPSNAPIGTWVYDEHTQYVFEKDGSGKLLADDMTYTYLYSVKGKKLRIDFTEDIVRDCEYTFSVKNATLTLVGGTGTDGGTYRLSRK